MYIKYQFHKRYIKLNSTKSIMHVQINANIEGNEHKALENIQF